jgi:hypothetical protein
VFIPLHCCDHRSLTSVGHSGNDGHGGKTADPKKQESHNNGVGGSSLAGTRHKQGNTAESAGALGEFPQSGSQQGGSVSGGSGSLLSIFSGTPTRYNSCDDQIIIFLNRECWRWWRR